MTFQFFRLLVILFTSITIIACSEKADSNTNDTTATSQSAESVNNATNTAAPSESSVTAPAKSETSESSTTSESTAKNQQKTTALAASTKQLNFVAGTHYDIIDPSIEVSGDKVQVTELFWYGCAHCFRLEPYIVQWKKTKADYIDFVEVPAVFGPQWKFHAQAFYTTKSLGIKEESHQKIFDSIHVSRQRVGNLPQLQDLLETLGQSPEKTEAAFNSFAVDSNLRGAQLFSQKSGARAVPTIVVDGQYKTSVGQAGGHDQLIQLINYLAKKSYDERKG